MRVAEDEESAAATDELPLVCDAADDGEVCAVGSEGAVVVVDKVADTRQPFEGALECVYGVVAFRGTGRTKAIAGDRRARAPAAVAEADGATEAECTPAAEEETAETAE
jgi:hypothetical protein